MNCNTKPRPEGFDYQQPDPTEQRCPNCNQNGRNRTGLVTVGLVGALTTVGYAIECGKCKNGLIKK